VLSWLGDLAGPAVLAIAAATAIGWRGAFAATALVVALFAVLLLLVEHPEPPARTATERSLAHEAMTLVRSRPVLLLATAEALLLPLDEAFLGFAIARAAGTGGAASAQLLAVGLVAGGLAGSGLVGRYGLDRRLVRGGNIAAAAGAAGTAASPLLAVEAVSMAGMGLGTAVIWASIHHRSLTLVPGRASTVPTVVSTLATPALLAAPAIGWFADTTSLPAGLALSASLVVPLVVVVHLLDRLPATGHQP
jgi:hypothetical protein